MGAGTGGGQVMISDEGGGQVTISVEGLLSMLISNDIPRSFLAADKILIQFCVAGEAGASIDDKRGVFCVAILSRGV